MGEAKRRGSPIWWLLTLPLIGLLVRNYVNQFRFGLAFRPAFLNNLGLLALLVAVCLWIQGRSFWPRPLIATRRQLAALLAVLIVGVLARTVHFDIYPPDDGQLWEESQMGAAAADAAYHGGLDSFFPLTTLTAEVGFRLLGVSMRALRLPFVVLGAASVAVFFVAARLFFNTYFAAFFTTALFASCAMLAGASRVALETMAPIFTTAVALAALFYACAKRSVAAYALAGFANGLLALEYFSYKVLPGFAGLLLLMDGFQPRTEPYCNTPPREYRLANLCAALPGLLAFGAFACAAAAPVVLASWYHELTPLLDGYARHHHGLTIARAQLTFQQALWADATRMGQAASLVFWQGTHGDLLPLSMGVVDVYTGVLGVVALVYCAVRARRCPAKLFLVTAVILLVALSGWLTSSPARYRLVPLIPYYLLMIGVPVDDLCARVTRYRTALRSALLLGLIALCGFNLYQFFGVALNHPNVRANFHDLNMILTSEFAAIQRREPAATIYLLSDRDFLGMSSDYAFLYNPKRVRVVTSAAQLAQAHGYLFAHDRYIPAAQSLQGLSDCRQWDTGFGHTVLACRLR